MNELEQKVLEGAMDLVMGQTSKRQIDLESAVMTCPGFGYLEAWELLACVQARLERRYDNGYSPKVERAFIELRKALENAEEPQ